MADMVRVALIGDRDDRHAAHRAIPKAIQLSADELDLAVHPTWLHTNSLRGDVAKMLAGFSGIWCVPASPYANMRGAIDAIRYARESDTPFLGTCGGFQHALIEYARNVVGLTGAEHAELSPNAEMLLVTPLECALVEKSDAVIFCKGARLQDIYGCDQTVGEYQCRFGLNQQYEKMLFNGGTLKVAARDSSVAVRAMELEGPSFYIATLFQPERAALRDTVPPLVKAFVAAAASYDAG